jgi:peptide/nickel transport system ATP-binding protein
MSAEQPVLRVSAVSKSFPVDRGWWPGHGLMRKAPLVHAVDRVSLNVWPREVAALVGESGCGKSTLARIVSRLIPASSGDVWLDGMSLRALKPRQYRRWADAVQMVFQNPYASLNPRQRVREIIEEPLRVHRKVSKGDLRPRVEALMQQIGLETDLADRYPHQLSGGQCQRVAICRALTMTPKVLVCDEPVSALDVSTQTQVLSLFSALKEELSIAYLFISHDLTIVERLSDSVAVMYLGRIVEVSAKTQLFAAPAHPYTQALLESVPRLGKRPGRAVAFSGDRPSLLDRPPGCAFHPRCPRAMERCRVETPALKAAGIGHHVACHLYD